ncbi:hypothetical protein D3C76_616630 [compost metagenome]
MDLGQIDTDQLIVQGAHIEVECIRLPGTVARLGQRVAGAMLSTRELLQASGNLLVTEGNLGLLGVIHGQFLA